MKQKSILSEEERNANLLQAIKKKDLMMAVDYMGQLIEQAIIKKLLKKGIKLNDREQ